MTTKPKQDLSLLTGDYYHPEAEYKEYPWENGNIQFRGHKVNSEPHGIWEKYWEDGILRSRERYLHGQEHGLCESYRKSGAPNELKNYLEGDQIPFFIELLLGIQILDI